MCLNLQLSSYCWNSAWEHGQYFTYKDCHELEVVIFLHKYVIK